MQLATTKIELLRNSIYNVLNNELEWKIEGMEFWGNGVVNAVFLIKERNLGMLAVRTPWRADENSLDQCSSGLISLKKEFSISQHCSLHNIPVPKVHKLHLSEEINFLVSDFVSGDEIDISSYDIGQLTSEIHRVPIDGLTIIDQNERSLSKIISKRMKERVYTLNKTMNSTITIPSSSELEAVLNTSQIKDCLLHLDVRRPNLIGKKGTIKAIVDWDNAFIGNPIMELMRISETQELVEEEFMKGYMDTKILENTDTLIQSIYRLDTALMLSILFNSFIKDYEKGIYYLKRVHIISQEIRSNI